MVNGKLLNEKLKENEEYVRKYVETSNKEEAHKMTYLMTARGLAYDHKEFALALKILKPFNLSDEDKAVAHLGFINRGHLDSLVKKKDSRVADYIIELVNENYISNIRVREVIDDFGIKMSKENWKAVGEGLLKNGHYLDYYFTRSITQNQDFVERCFREAKDLRGLEEVLNKRVLPLEFLDGRGHLPNVTSSGRQEKIPGNSSFCGIENYIHSGIIIEHPAPYKRSPVLFRGKGVQFEHGHVREGPNENVNALVYSKFDGFDTKQDLIISIGHNTPAIIEKRWVSTPTNHFGDISIDDLSYLGDSNAEIEYHIGNGKHKRRRISCSKDEGHRIHLSDDVFDE